MSVAVLGDITFEASADKIRTWNNDATRNGGARWASLEVFMGKPVREFLGPGNASITLSVRLDINRGLVPRDELRKMREHRDKGEVLQFTIGGELVGDFTINDINETWTRFDRRGVLTTCVAVLQLEEYT